MKTIIQAAVISTSIAISCSALAEVRSGTIEHIDKNKKSIKIVEKRTGKVEEYKYTDTLKIKSTGQENIGSSDLQPGQTIAYKTSNPANTNKNNIKGKIVDIDYANKTAIIDRKKFRVNKKFTLSDSVKITGPKREFSASDLSVGQKVIMNFSNKNGHYEQLKGEIKSLDSVKKEGIVEGRKSQDLISVKFPVNLRVSGLGSKATINDLQPGQNIILKYSND